MVYAREPASFWREKVVAVITPLRVLARMSKWGKQVVKCKKFYHFAFREDVTSFTKGNSADLSGEKMVK